jgi:ferredoxin-NADP reductase
VSLKLLSRVDRIVGHGQRVYTVVLRPQRPAPRFRAGQFLHLALDPYDPSRFWPESRAFSIASSPADRDVLRILYSVRGRFTARMESELVEGRQVWIKMPYGEFFVDGRRDVVLFAGGTGISAFTAFIEALGPETKQSVVLAYGARTEDLLIGRDLVEACAKKTTALAPVFFVENPETVETDGTNLTAVEIGRVSVAAMWPKLLRPLNADHYISGPPAMLQTIARDLHAQGVAKEAIHIDAWE